MACDPDAIRAGGIAQHPAQVPALDFVQFGGGEVIK
jgi:hypothetical protein